MNQDFWYGVPEEKEYEWQKAFIKANDEKQGIAVNLPCPICFSMTLRHYYDGKRGLWQWCSSCRRYEHSQSFTPDWWHWELEYDRSELTAEPELLERAFSNKKGS